MKFFKLTISKCLFYKINSDTFVSKVNKVKVIKLEPIIQSEVCQKEKHQYSILMHIYGKQKGGNDDPICKAANETQM